MRFHKGSRLRTVLSVALAFFLAVQGTVVYADEVSTSADKEVSVTEGESVSLEPEESAEAFGAKEPPAGDVVCRQAFKECWKSGPGAAYIDSSAVKYWLHITALINRKTLKADVYFEMLDSHNGNPIDVDRIKQKDAAVYEGYPDFFEQAREAVHMTCDVVDYKNDEGTGTWDYFLHNFYWDNGKPFLLQSGQDLYSVSEHISLAHRKYENVGRPGTDYVGYGTYSTSLDKPAQRGMQFTFEWLDIPERFQTTEPERHYTIERDNFSFVNSKSSFPVVTARKAPGIANFGGKYTRGTYGYMTDIPTYSAMIKGLSPSQYAEVNKILNRSFNGACHGMSILSGLLYGGQIRIGQVGGTGDPYSLNAPKENEDLLKPILYYQVYGNYDRKQKIIDAYRKSKDGAINPLSDLVKLMEEDPDSPVVVGFSNDAGMSHSVLAFKLEKITGDYAYDVSIYDPNVPKSVQHLMVPPSVMTVDHYVQPRIERYGTVYVEESFRAKDYYNKSLVYPILTGHEAIASTDGKKTEVAVGNKKGVIENGKVSGNLETAVISDPCASDEETAVTDIFIYDTEGQPICVKRSDSGEQYASIQTPDTFLLASGGASELTLNPDGSVSGKTNGTTGSIAVAQDIAEGDLTGITVTTKAAEISIVPSRNGAHIESVSGYADIMLSGKTETVTFSDIEIAGGVDIVTAGKTVTITADGKEIAKGTASDTGGSSEKTDPEENPETDSAWYQDYEYTLTDSEIRLHNSKGTLKSSEICIPASAVINGKSYQVVLDKQLPEGIGETCSLWERDVETIKKLSFEPGVRVSEDGSYLFGRIMELTDLDVSGLDTSRVTNMEGMFSALFNLTSLDVSSLNTSSAENMSTLFAHAFKLEKITFGKGFDTSAVTDMSYMFQCDWKLESLDLSRFDTSSVKEMQGMFDDCTVLKELDLSYFKTGNTRNMSEMFHDCSALAKLDLRSFDFTTVNTRSSKAVSYVRGMFSGSGIKELYLPALAMENVDFTDKNNVVTSLEKIYYAGTKAQWEALQNTLPKEVTVTCSDTGEEVDPEKPDTKDTVTALFVEPKSLTLTAPTGNVPGSSGRLSVSVCPAIPAGEYITFSASPDGIVSVSDDGLVTAFSAGDVVITASCGGKSAYADVHVKDASVKEEDEKNYREGEFWVGEIAPMIFTGAALKPEPSVYFGSALLKKGTDYSLSYVNNINVPANGAPADKQPAVKIAFRGSYTGSLTKNFTITPMDLGDSKVIKNNISALVKTGQNATQKLAPVLTYNGKNLTATKDKDIHADYPDTAEGAYEKAGTWKVTLTGKGNYAGTVDVTETLVDKSSGRNLAAAKVTIDEASTKSKYPLVSYDLYTGEAKEPVFRLTDQTGETELIRGTDYEVTYSNNVNVGKATVTFTAIGNTWYGQKSITFPIKKNPADLASSKTEAVIAGKTAQTVGFDSTGKAFTVPIVWYAKGGVKPGVSLALQGTELIQGTDYTVSYKSDLKNLTGSITIKGKGDYYKGTLIIPFTIEKRDIADVSCIVDDYVESKTQNGYKKVKIILTDLDGKNLSMGKEQGKNDYYIDPASWRINGEKPGDHAVPKDGDIVSMTIKGSGNYYTGSVPVSFRVIKKSRLLSGVKLDGKITTAAFSGSSVYLTKENLIDKLYVNVKSNGRTVKNSLILGIDYSILSYSGNDKAGTAKVTLKGLGDYGGIKTVSFTIPKRSK